VEVGSGVGFIVLVGCGVGRAEGLYVGSFVGFGVGLYDGS
jgi:hypothetical protein